MWGPHARTLSFAVDICAVGLLAKLGHIPWALDARKWFQGQKPAPGLKLRQCETTKLISVCNQRVPLQLVFWRQRLWHLPFWLTLNRALHSRRPPGPPAWHRLCFPRQALQLPATMCATCRAELESLPTLPLCRSTFSYSFPSGGHLWI